VFHDAVAAYRVYDLRTRFDAESVAAVRSSAARAGFLLVGELHKRPETPRAIYTLMRTLDFHALALEWESDLEPLVSAYLADGSDATEALSDNGRITPGHFALLARLQSEGRLERLVLLDETSRDWAGDWAERDARMAQSLLRKRDLTLPMLVIVGEFHTRVVPQPGGVPLGALLAEVIPELPVAVIRYGDTDSPRPIGRFGRGRDGRFVFALPSEAPHSVA